MDKVSGIYCILNMVNRRRYIGKSNNIYKRWGDEKSALKRHDFHNIHLQRAWDKYGEDAFEWSIIETCEESILIQKEIEWIEYYDSYANGYNQTRGGEGSVGAVCSEEKRQKLSQSHSGDKSYRKRVYCIELQQEYWGAKEAERQLLQYGVRGSEVTRCCRRQAVYSGCLPDGMKLHWCYIQDVDIFKMPITKNSIPVYCIELNCFYANPTTAQNDCRILKAHSGNIKKCCENDARYQTCGVLVDGTKLTWRYATLEEIENLFIIIQPNNRKR
jgi:group I intron endonuclease